MIDKRLNSLKRSVRIKCGRGMPHYIQIYEGVQYCLENNHWKAGEKFGNLEELAELFGVSRLTVKHAIKPFLEKGILVSKRGKGLFVNVVFDEPPRMTFRTDWGSYTKLVEDTKIIILESDRRTECPWDLSEFKSFPPSYQYLMKVHSKSEKPYGVIETYFDAELFDLSPRIYAEEATLVALERIKPNTVHDMKQKITIGRADSTTATLLEIPTGEPIALSRRTALDKTGKLIYVTMSKYPGDRVQIDINIDIKKLQNSHSRGNANS